MDKIIEKYYESNNFPSADKLYKYLKADNVSVSKKQVQEYLSKQTEVQLTKETKIHKSKDGHIVAMFANQIWQIDIFILQKYVKVNHGYRDILCAVDVFTRKSYCVPMKTKDIDDCTMALSKIFKIAGLTPKTIMSDNDSSFKGEKFQKLLKTYEVDHDMNIVGDHHALAIVDRFARTLKSILTKIFLRNKKNNWYDYLEKVINTYNNSPHSGILDIKPNDADTDDNISLLVEHNKKLGMENITKPDLVKGDKVRIRTKGIFDKGTEPLWSHEVYVVDSMKGKQVELNGIGIRKRDQLLKVHKETKGSVEKTVIAKAKKEYKKDQILKKEDMKVENVRVGNRVRKANSKYIQV